MLTFVVECAYGSVCFTQYWELLKTAFDELLVSSAVGPRTNDVVALVADWRRLLL